MKFEISETINECAPETVLSLFETQLRKISGHVIRNGQSITATQIEASFGSINRSSTAVCSVRGNGRKGILTADVDYRPSLAFWVFLILGLFTMLGWLIPIAFYLIQKGTVRSAVEAVFRRVRAECEFTEITPATPQTTSDNETSPTSVTESRKPNGLHPAISDSYSALGLPVWADEKAAEEVYLRLSKENDPAALQGYSNEIQELAKSRTVEIRVAYAMVTAHIATRA
jgi:hypothetical protein